MSMISIEMIDEGRGKGSRTHMTSPAMQIEKMIEYGFIKESTKSDYFFSEDINSIISYLKDYEYIKGKWEI